MVFKKTILSTLLIMFAIFTAVSGADAQAKNAALPTVSRVDLSRYAGKWYEIARYPNKFQEKCVGNTTATYTLKLKGKIEVKNECLTQDGTVDTAIGEAKVEDTTTNAKLKVRFAPKFLSFLSAVWGDYWILDLDAQYRNVLIGEPGREYLWILSREPQMSDARYDELLSKAESLGFDPKKVIRTPQNVTPVKSK